MAEIYLARAVGIEGFEKLVVVKRILPQFAKHTQFVRMFLDEARIAATLHHPNIVQVYDIGLVRGSYFFAMEFLHGADLRRIMSALWLQKRRLPLEHGLGIVMGACAGLHYAHERLGFDGDPLNIVHRDVSPANVFVTFDGGVKLVDFGIAKATRRLTHTRQGGLKGKIRYMSPEQCAGAPIDRRSDVFAAAVILWEITTGRRLWHGNSEFELMKAVVETEPPMPSSAEAGYPPLLEPIVMKGLRRRPEDRYQTAQELQGALEAYTREHRLAVSSITLGEFMRELFAAEMAAWLAAQRAGKGLGEHLAEALQDAAPTVSSLEVELEYDPAPVEKPGPLAGARDRLPGGPALAPSDDLPITVSPSDFGPSSGHMLVDAPRPVDESSAGASAASRRPTRTITVLLGAAVVVLIVAVGWLLRGRDAQSPPSTAVRPAPVGAPAAPSAPPEQPPASGPASATAPAAAPEGRRAPPGARVDPRRVRPPQKAGSRPAGPRKRPPRPNEDPDSPLW
jgi:hypothetical protein